MEDSMDEERWERHRRKREFRRRHHSPEGQAFGGIMLVLFGLIFLLSNMGYVDARYVFRNFWPLILVLIGARMLIFDRGPDNWHGTRGAGVIWVVIGGVFLLSNLNFINVAFRTIWPFFPIAIGAFILWKVLIDRDGDIFPPGERVIDQPPGQERELGQDQDDREPNSSSRIRAHAFMGHVSRRSNSQEFHGANLSTFMGGCEVDLRGATPAAGGAVIDVSAFMGGIEIRLPTDWTVVNRVTPFLGAVEDETHPSGDESKKLIVRGSVFMGGLELKN
jgi:predicted membrane protein